MIVIMLQESLEFTIFGLEMILNFRPMQAKNLDSFFNAFYIAHRRLTPLIRRQYRSQIRFYVDTVKITKLRELLPEHRT